MIASSANVEDVCPAGRTHETGASTNVKMQKKPGEGTKKKLIISMGANVVNMK